ncbi:MAG TPA: nucleotidyltransferase [Clostridiales bacterium]|nr:MAG: hypothetical protein A2Y22_00905 [Clostridiales bacterium GWD2_32_59]HAN10220.1 nucleotidyltransferase [Clostridiales bacterium]
MVTKIPKQIIELVKRYKDEIMNKDHEIDSIYIFGSYVKASYHEFSDIDVAIVINDKNADVHKKTLEYMMYVWDIDTRIEPHIFIKDDLKENFLWGSIKNELYKIA